jgi:hypothetical protein
MTKHLLFTFLGTLLYVGIMSAQTRYSGNTNSQNFPPYDTTVKVSSTNLPIVFINVKGQVIERENKVLCTVKIINNSDGINYGDTVSHPNQTVDWYGPASIKYRGNSSFLNSDKKPFAIRPLKTWNVDGDKDKVKIMGMGKDNDWALLAPWEDKSYMRDVLTMELARGGNTFAPHMKFCELYLDGVYRGIYLMAERATKGKSRLNLNDIGSDSGDLTGDFHVEIDRDDETHYYTSKHHPVMTDGTEISYRNITYQYKDPEYDDFATLPTGAEAAEEQAIDDMENAFASSNYKDADTGYRAYIDVPSFIDFEIAQEFSNNIDGYRLSSPLYKYSKTHATALGTNAKWKTALWDFNIAYGNVSYYSPNSDVWRYEANDYMYNRDSQLIPFFWYKLMNDDSYVKELKARWTLMRGGNYNESYITSKIDSLQNVLTTGGAITRDNQAWGSHFGTLSSAVSTLKSFITNRLSFMDSGWLKESGGDVTTTTLPITIKSGYNADVIAEATPTSSYASIGLDKWNYAFYSSGTGKSNPLAGSDGKISASTGVNYQLASYASNNVLRLEENGEGTLDFTTPVTTDKLYVLGISADGTSSVTATVLYSDNTTADFTLSLSDWCASGSGTVALSGIGRVNTANDDFNTSQGCHLNECTIATSKSTTITGVKFKNTSSGSKANIFALSMKAETTGIGRTLSTGERTLTGIYNINGMQMSALQKGINILKYSDGTIRKIIIR